MPDKVMQGVGQERFGMRQRGYEIVRLLSAGLSSGLWWATGANTANVSRWRSCGLWLPPPKLHRRKTKY